MAKCKEWIGGRILWWCPGCKENHIVTTQNKNHCGAQWSWNGNVDQPTIQPSVVTGNPSYCHCYVTDGSIQFLSDCKHALKGQTVSMEDWED